MSSSSSLLPTEPNAETVADSSETLPKIKKNLQEERFLQSRLARRQNQNKKKKNGQHDGDDDNDNYRQSKTDTLHAFWNVLRQKLKQWQEKLVAVEQEEYKKGENNNKKKNHQDARTELERLRFELNQWRKYCLSNNIAATTADIAALGNSDDEELLLKILPEDLPVSDLRLLHTEFTKYSSLWEDVHDRLFPKGKFIFRRYREELARQQIQQEEDLLAANNAQKLKNQTTIQPQKDRTSSNITQQQTSSRRRHPIRGFGNNNTDAILENVSYHDIIVSATGSVSTTIHTPPSNEDEDDDEAAAATSQLIDDKEVDTSTTIAGTATIPLILSSTSLLIRNLQHCSLVM